MVMQVAVAFLRAESFSTQRFLFYLRDFSITAVLNLYIIIHNGLTIQKFH